MKANAGIIVTAVAALVAVAFALALVTSPWTDVGHPGAASSGSVAIQPRFVAHCPADSQSHQPAELTTLSTGANHLFDAVRSRHWSTPAGTAHRMSTAHAVFGAAEVPQRICTEVNNALESVNSAVRARRARQGTLGALEAAQAGLDLHRYRPTIQVNVSRFNLRAGETIAGPPAT